MSPSLQALLRELAAFNTGLCVITTRMPVADIADYGRTTALRRDLEQLSSDAGAKLLRALGAKGDEAELRNASDEFSGHCLALTLLGSYLTDAYNGDIRYRQEVSKCLAHGVYFSAMLGYYERNASEVERLTTDLIELSTRQDFAFYLPVAEILRGWVCSASGHTAEGIAWIEDGIRRNCTIGSMLTLPVWLGAKAEALYFADRTSEALEAIREAEARVERFEERAWSAELYRFRSVFLAAIGADETQIEASFCEAIRIAKEQKSVSL